MKLLPGGVFGMGSERFYPEERPCRRAAVDSFWIDETPVTNRQFAAFVEATGYRTCAEVAPNPADYPGMDLSLAKPGSLVFVETSGPVDLRDFRRWWEFRLGAQWRRPSGDGSSLAELADHPVVHVSYADALAYAAWAGKSLPTETEWEYAARGGLAGAEFAWGDEFEPQGEVLANYWRGEFPWARQQPHRWNRTSPVRSFPPNGYGLYDMIGNVWEWTCDEYALPSARRASAPCCGADASPKRLASLVVKGGSHLCAASYCQRYRPAARSPQAADTSASHLGFRCIVREHAAASSAQS
ncbi:MAG TPA: formylglycine-generating enzyme family protein [Steroidobacteraceae bacterium]